MRTIDFTKMVAAGNDFVVIGIKSQKLKIKNLNKFAKIICDRKYGVGADGLLVITESKVADIKMRIFNADGSEAEMCGNGARCAALWAKFKIKNQKSEILKIETKAGIIDSRAAGDNVKIKLTAPSGIKEDIPIKINSRTLKVNFVNTGVPHAVIFVNGITKIDVPFLGRAVRINKKFAPKGTNTDFVEILNKGAIKLRTYERGIEDETLACGTGSAAAAVITGLKLGLSGEVAIKVFTQSGEILKVYFINEMGKISNVWLEGKASIAYKGVYNV